MLTRLGAALTGAFGLLVACGGSTTAPPGQQARSLSGNWGADGRSFASLALTERAGTVTGLGWIEGAPGIGVLVAGVREGSNVDLVLRPRLRDGELTFRGQFDGTRLTGAVGSGPLIPANVDLRRVDTVAAAFATFAITGGITRDDSAYATVRVTLEGAGIAIERGPNLIWLELPTRRVTVGTYPLAPGAANGAAAIVLHQIWPGDPSRFDVTRGTLRITDVGPRALIGTFQFDATGSPSVHPTESLPISVAGTFSAACQSVSDGPCILP